ALSQLEIFANSYYKELNDATAAIAIYNEILKIRGEVYRADYYNRLGNLNYYKEDFQKAADEYDRAIATQPKVIYHRNLAEAYKQLKNWDGAASEVLKAKQLSKDEKLYNRDMALIRNAEGNEFFSKGAFLQAIDKYKESVIFDPEDDIIYSNLAKAWENVKDLGMQHEALQQAIIAYTKANKINPGKTYSKAIERLEKKESFIQAYGGRAASNTLVVSPIIMEVSADLVPFFEGVDQGSMSPELKNEVAELRSRMLQNFGIRIPNILFRPNEAALVTGSYIIMLDEIPMVQGTVNTEQRFVAASEETLQRLGINGVVNSNSFLLNNGFWIEKDDGVKAQANGIELWEVVRYPLRHLEFILIKNLSDFVGHQEISDLLQKEVPDAYNEIQGKPQKQSAFVAVCKGLVSEQSPLLSLGKIYETFNELYKPEHSLLEIVEAARLLPEVRSKLSGQEVHRTLLPLGTEFQKEIEHSLYKKDGHTVLALTPENCQSALATIKNQVTANQHVALLTENATIRPFIRKFIEIDFPNVPVLSKKEIGAEAENRVAILPVELDRSAAERAEDFNEKNDIENNDSRSNEDQPARIMDEVNEEQSAPVVIKVFVNNLLADKQARSDDKPICELFELMQDGLFYELGILLPEVELITDTSLKVNEFRLQINALEFTGAGLMPNEFLVNDTVSKIAAHGLRAKEEINPANGNASAVLTDENDNLEKCKEIPGFTIWGPAGFIILRLSSEIRKAASSFQTIKSTAYSLSMVEAVHPNLVATTLATFSEEQICLVLKSLLDEEISIKNMRSILESLLSVRGSTDVDLSKYIVFLPQAENLCFVSGKKTKRQLETIDLTNIVRNGLKRYITYKYSSSGTMIAYLLDPKIEDRINKVIENPLNEEEENELQVAIAQEIGTSFQPAQKPVILTTLLERRHELRRIIKPVLPHIAVLNFQELSPDANIQPVARITWELEKAVS
ncbi:MAG: FHIPEP family type III secretion protein, partial [Bacteroidota bacterium]|nr:FHIPEP family type III secretion protein [Bacteroidota bacterium]